MDALSFYHAGALESYRQTLALRTESATTEQLREAMIRYRALFEDLTGLRDGHGSPSATAWRRSATATPAAVACRQHRRSRERRPAMAADWPCRGERHPDCRHAPIGITYLEITTEEMIPMTQDQYGQTRGPVTSSTATPSPTTRTKSSPPGSPSR